MPGQTESKGDNPLKVSLDPKDPNLLDTIKKEILDRKITGEDNNKLLVFLVCLSAFTKNPLSAVIKAASGAGKSHLVNKVLDPFRKMGIVIEYSRITGAYLENMAKQENPIPKPAKPDRRDYTKVDNFDKESFFRAVDFYKEKLAEYVEQAKKPRRIDLTGKILFVAELRGIQNAQAPKLLISEGRLRLGTVINGYPVEIEVVGTPVIITTTTLAVLDDPEFENRVIPIQIDESEEQTSRVLEYEASHYLDPAEDLTEQTRMQSLVNLFNQLQPYGVANPYAGELARDYPKKNVEARRDFPKLMNLSNVVTWLYQHQRVRAKKGLDVVLVAELADVEKVKDLALVSLKESLTGISEKEQAILDFLRPQPKPVTVKQIYEATRKQTRRGEDWTRKYVKRLVMDGYAEEDQVKPNRFEYRYAELQPESLEITTELYPEQVLEEWAKATGYTLTEGAFSVNSSTSQGQAEPSPYPSSEPVPSRYEPSQHETQETGDIPLGNSSDVIVDELTPKGAKKKDDPVLPEPELENLRDAEEGADYEAG